MATRLFAQQIGVLRALVLSVIHAEALSLKWSQCDAGEMVFVSDEWLSLFSPARVSLKAMTDYIQDETKTLDLFKKDHVATDALHLPILDGVIDGMQDFMTAKTALCNVLSQVSQAWTEHLNKLVDVLHQAASFTPWQVWITANDLPTPEQKTALYQNPFYKQLAPLGEKLAEMLNKANELATMGDCGPLFSVETMRKGADLRELAFDTVSLSCVVNKVAEGCLVREAALSLHLLLANSAPLHELLAVPCSLSLETEGAKSVQQGWRGAGRLGWRPQEQTPPRR